ncbi:MAG: hypothetical protein LBK66_04245 [Spirochaetaceae bacterium]|nr:hypothetical protein [Spirochaetaceae bacterium]
MDGKPLTAVIKVNAVSRPTRNEQLTIINEQLGMRSDRGVTTAIEPKTAPPPTAQTSLRRRQNANAERM